MYIHTLNYNKTFSIYIRLSTVLKHAENLKHTFSCFNKNSFQILQKHLYTFFVKKKKIPTYNSKKAVTNNNYYNFKSTNF